MEAATESSAPPLELHERFALAAAAPTPVAERALVQPASQAPSRSLDSKTCEIRGRFVLPGGAPAANAHYEIRGWESNDEDVRRYGLPDHWDDLVGQTDADGRLSERFEPPRAYQFTLKVNLAGYAGAKWRWGEILTGAVVDVGEIELVVGGVIEGRIIDADGKVVPGDWYVYATSVGLGELDGRDEISAREWARPDGSFRVEDVMPGRVELNADGDDWTEDTSVQVRSGATTTADIVTKRREAVSRTTLEASWKRLYSVGPEPEHVSLTGPDGAVVKPKASHIGFFMGGFTFEDLVPGEYRVAIDDPRFQSCSRTMRPGETVRVELEGTSALELRVRGADEKAIEFYSLEVELRNVNFSPHSFQVFAPSSDVEHGRLGGLVSGDYRLTVHADDGVGALDVDGLAPGETRPVEVRVGAPRVIRGVVRYSDGAPAVGVDVALRESGGEVRSVSSTVGVEGNVRFSDDEERGATDERGEFRFAVARGGAYVVHANDVGGMGVDSEPIHLADADLDGVELVLARGGFLEGRVLAPPGMSLSGMHVWAEGAHFGTQPREMDADGRFEFGPLPPGATKVHLQLPIQWRRDGAGSSTGSAGPSLELGELEVVDGKRVEHDFTVEAPGTVVLTVLVNGEALAGVSVQLNSAQRWNGAGVNGETDTRGQTGSLRAFAGSWKVRVNDVDAGWRYDHPTPVVVASVAESHAQISVSVSEATLQFLDAQSGKPLAKQMISVLGPPGDRMAEFPWQRKKTDAEGRARWTLASGEYRFRLDAEGEEFPFFPDEDQPAEPARIAPLSWTLQGPLAHEVRL